MTAVAAAAALGAAAAVWGVGIERHLFTVRRATVPILEPGSEPIRVLHISDVHMAPWQRRKQAWIASLTSLDPDLIVNTGDNLGHADGLRGIRAAFAGFRGIPGVFVHGSNDHTAPSPRNPLRYFTGPVEEAPDVGTARHRRRWTPSCPTRSAGRTSTTPRPASRCAGTASTCSASATRTASGTGSTCCRDWSTTCARARSDLNGDGFADEAADRHPLTLGVTHAPYRRVLDAFTGLGADMIFAGHTHGGQVRVPGFGALVANCDIPLKQARGLSSWTHGRDDPAERQRRPRSLDLRAGALRVPSGGIAADAGASRVSPVHEGGLPIG